MSGYIRKSNKKVVFDITSAASENMPDYNVVRQVYEGREL